IRSRTARGEAVRNRAAAGARRPKGVAASQAAAKPPSVATTNNETGCLTAAEENAPAGAVVAPLDARTPGGVAAETVLSKSLTQGPLSVLWGRAQSIEDGSGRHLFQGTGSSCR